MIHTHKQRKNFTKYDDNQYLLYLNEQVAEYTEPESEITVSGYSYEGDMPDGSTIVESSDGSRDSLISGLMRKTYSQHAAEAIIFNAYDNSPEHVQELADLQAYRISCKEKIDEMLSREV